MLIRGCLFLLLTGCMANSGASTASVAQENVWNLSRIAVGMEETEVLRIMHCPQKKKTISHGAEVYHVWFYVTKPTAFGQDRLVRYNVTPLTFKKGVLQAWGFDYYDHIAAGPHKKVQKAKKSTHSREDKPLEKDIEVLEKPSPHSKMIMTQNDDQDDCPQGSDNECDRPKKGGKKPNLSEEDEEMLDDEREQNFNFW